MGKQYTPERAYRWAVLPLGIHLSLCGVIFLGAALFMSADRGILSLAPGP